MRAPPVTVALLAAALSRRERQCASVLRAAAERRRRTAQLAHVFRHVREPTAHDAARRFGRATWASSSSKWVFQAQSLESFETTPLVVDGVMYLTEAPNTAVALDARTGRPFWRYQYNPSPTRARAAAA